jgi:N-acyl-D-amino-acid deacylase
MYDVVIRSGTIYDGTGNEPFMGDVALKDERIVAIDKSIKERADIEIDAAGLAVAPGFINMLSQANESLIQDGRSLSDIKQGVTLEVMGEAVSMGPLNQFLKQDRIDRQGDIKFDITWTKLSEYLDFLVRRGVSTNVASFVGATTLRRYVIGDQDRAPTQKELAKMQDLVREAMQEGALGVTSALIYAPAFFAKTNELIALAQAAAEYDGMYCSHLRSEGDAFLEGLDEFLETAEHAKIRAEIYHLKAAGQSNWHKMNKAISKIEEARHRGLSVTANMYMYTAACTCLDAAMPPWVQDGGNNKWVERLKERSIREKVKQEMLSDGGDWENGFRHAGPEGMLLVDFKSDKLKPLTGKSLSEVAAMRGRSPADVAIDLVIEDNSPVGVVYFWMSEENVRKQLALPWVSVCSDSESLANEGVFLKSNPHPRAYGNFARFLGKYVHQEKVTTLQDAIRRLTMLPAANLKISGRGSLSPGYFADVVVFDPDDIIDKATYENPHQYAEGMVHVFVNGKQVLKQGHHTGALPGQVVHGPGRA